MESIQLIEVSNIGKVSPEKCEDTYIVTDNYVAVIDGVSSKTPFEYEGKTTGKIAAEIVAEVIGGLDKESNITDINRAINQEFEAFYERVAFPYDPIVNGLQAVAIIYSKYYHTIWLVGDCLGLVGDDVITNPKRSDTILEELRSLLWWFDHFREDVTKYDPEQNDRGRQSVAPWDTEARQFCNDDSTPFGYSVFNGEMIPPSLIKTFPLDENISEICLCSDGYPKIFSSLSKTEEYLKMVLEIDPNGVDINPRMRGILPNQMSYDDRTYVRFKINKD